MTDLVIIGTGGCARQVHQAVEDAVAEGRPWFFIGFLERKVTKIPVTTGFMLYPTGDRTVKWIYTSPFNFFM
jgi:hypothetical protein